jgi:hypothetical protein
VSELVERLEKRLNKDRRGNRDWELGIQIDTDLYEDVASAIDEIERLNQLIAAHIDHANKLHERLVKKNEALEMIAGIRQCPDNLLGNPDIARLALTDEKGEKS